MDLLLRIAVGVVGALVVALVLYSFRVRQLYLVVPKLFSYGGLADKALLVELQIFNKSRLMEEDVRISLPPNCKYEIVAADYQDAKIVDNNVTLSRLSPQSEVAILILADGAIDANNLVAAITSKNTKGRQFKRREDLIPNIGNLTVFTVLVAIFVFGVPYGLDKYTARERAQEEQSEKDALAKYDYLNKDGWREYADQLDTDSLKQYAPAGFPLSLVDLHCKRDICQFSFDVANNTTSPIKIEAYNEYYDNVLAERTDADVNIKDLIVDPLSSKRIVVTKGFPKGIDYSHFEITFYVAFGPATSSDLLTIKFYPVFNSRFLDAMHLKAMKAS